MNNPVIISTFNTPEEASIVQGMLISNGIECRIDDRTNLYVPVFNGVNLIVDEKDAEKASQLLKEHND